MLTAAPAAETLEEEDYVDAEKIDDKLSCVQEDQDWLSEALGSLRVI
jgi:hypothetical protein